MANANWKEIIDLCGGPEKFKELSNIKPKKEVTMAKERNIDDALHSMNELIEMQQQALGTADELFKIKDARLEIADRLINIYKKENRVLKICFYSLVAFNIITSIIRLI